MQAFDYHITDENKRVQNSHERHSITCGLTDIKRTVVLLTSRVSLRLLLSQRLVTAPHYTINGLTYNVS